MHAIDTPHSVDGNVLNIISAGFHGMIRYISPSTVKFPDKRLTISEVASIQSFPGVGIGLVWESGPTSVDYFSTDQGTADANDALGVVSSLGIPTKIPVFFAVDFDALNEDVQGPILDYFKAIHDGVFDPAGRPVGVYGSGAVCSAFQKAGVVHFTWLAQSRGWRGFLDWKTSADVIQGPTTQVSGLDVDTDFVVNEATLWTVNQPSP